jgi:hypothetical protein
VPEDRQVESSPELAGPVIERLRFLEEDNPLTAMYLNLLTTSIDKARQEEAHPAFGTTLNQMSRDEVVVLERLRRSGAVLKMVPDQPKSLIVFLGTDPEQPFDLAFRNQLGFYVEHLRDLSILQWSMFVPSDGSDVPIKFTTFGKRFLEVCSPEPQGDTKDKTSEAGQP